MLTLVTRVRNPKGGASISLLQSVQAATHPGRMPEFGRRGLELDPTAEDVLEALDREAEEDGE